MLIIEIALGIILAVVLLAIWPWLLLIVAAAIVFLWLNALTWKDVLGGIAVAAVMGLLAWIMSLEARYKRSGEPIPTLRDLPRLTREMTHIVRRTIKSRLSRLK